MKPYERSDRIRGHLLRILSETLRRHIKDPRLEAAVISGAKLTRDLRIARVYYTVPGGPTRIEEARQGFESARGFIKRTLARELGLRYMPNLEFFYDESFDYGERIDQVLKSIERENGSNTEPSEK